MSFIRLMCKAALLDRKKLELEQEKHNSIALQKGVKTKRSLKLKYRHRCIDLRKKISRCYKRCITFPEHSCLFKFFYNLKHEGTCENYTLKSIIGFISGFIITYVFFMFFVFQLNFKFSTATIMCSIFGSILTIGLAFSYKVRCIVFLTLPQLFSKRGRQALLAYAFILAITGPAKNTLNNMGILSESLACGQEQLKSAVKQIWDVIKKPFYAIRDAVRAVVKVVKIIVKKIKEILLAIKRVVIAILKVIKAVFHFLAKVINICNKELGTPFQRCTRVFERAIADCHAKLGPMFSWLCSITYLVQSVCYTVKIFDFLCILIDFISDSIVGVVVKKIKNFIRHIKTMFYVRIKFSHSYHMETNASKSLEDVAKGIVTEVKTRTEGLIKVFDFMSCATSLFFMFIIIRVIYYRYKFLTNERFDNRFITKDFRNIDIRRAQMGKETVLPLNNRERTMYVTVGSCRLVKKEKLKLSQSAVVLGTATLKLATHMMADYVLYWVLLLIRTHASFQSSFEGDSIPTLHVKGEGLLADLLRSIVRAFQPIGVRLEIDTIPCLPDPIPPDYDRYVQIASLLVICWILTIFEPYGLRWRHSVMCYYQPLRARQRAVWLYNHILRTRSSFLKFARRQLRRKITGDSTINKVTCKEYLRANIRCRIFRLCLGEDKQNACLLCGEVFREGDPIKPIYCQTPGCPGVYCEQCFQDLQNLCTVCLDPIQYGDLSDISEEKDSSEITLKPDALLRKKKKKKRRKMVCRKRKSDYDDDSSDDGDKILSSATYDSISDSDYYSSDISSDLSYTYQHEKDITKIAEVPARRHFVDVEKQHIPDYASLETFRDDIKLTGSPLPTKTESDSTEYYNKGKTKDTKKKPKTRTLCQRKPKKHSDKIPFLKMNSSTENEESHDTKSTRSPLPSPLPTTTESDSTAYYNKGKKAKDTKKKPKTRTLFQRRPKEYSDKIPLLKMNSSTENEESDYTKSTRSPLPTTIQSDATEYYNKGKKAKDTKKKPKTRTLFQRRPKEHSDKIPLLKMNSSTENEESDYTKSTRSPLLSPLPTTTQSDSTEYYNKGKKAEDTKKKPKTRTIFQRRSKEHSDKIPLLKMNSSNENEQSDYTKLTRSPLPLPLPTTTESDSAEYYNKGKKAEDTKKKPNTRTLFQRRPIEHSDKIPLLNMNSSTENEESETPSTFTETTFIDTPNTKDKPIVKLSKLKPKSKKKNIFSTKDGTTSTDTTFINTPRKKRDIKSDVPKGKDQFPRAASKEKQVSKQSGPSKSMLNEPKKPSQYKSVNKPDIPELDLDFDSCKCKNPPSKQKYEVYYRTESETPRSGKVSPRSYTISSPTSLTYSENTTSETHSSVSSSLTPKTPEDTMYHLYGTENSVEGFNQANVRRRIKPPESEILSTSMSDVYIKSYKHKVQNYYNKIKKKRFDNPKVTSHKSKFTKFLNFLLRKDYSDSSSSSRLTKSFLSESEQTSSTVISSAKIPTSNIGRQINVRKSQFNGNTKSTNIFFNFLMGGSLSTQRFKDKVKKVESDLCFSSDSNTVVSASDKIGYYDSTDSEISELQYEGRSKIGDDYRTNNLHNSESRSFCDPEQNENDPMSVERRRSSADRQRYSREPPERDQNYDDTPMKKNYSQTAEIRQYFETQGGGKPYYQYKTPGEYKDRYRRSCSSNDCNYQCCRRTNSPNCSDNRRRTSNELAKSAENLRSNDQCNYQQSKTHCGSTSKHKQGQQSRSSPDVGKNKQNMKSDDNTDNSEYMYNDYMSTRSGPNQMDTKNKYSNKYPYEEPLHDNIYNNENHERNCACDHCHRRNQYRNCKCCQCCRSRMDDQLSSYSDDTCENGLNLAYQKNEDYPELVDEIENTISQRNKERVKRTMRQFEILSRQNKCLDKPLYDDDEEDDNRYPCNKRCPTYNYNNNKQRQYGYDRYNNYQTRSECLSERPAFSATPFPRNRGYVEKVARYMDPTLSDNTHKYPKYNNEYTNSRWQMDSRSGEWVKVYDDNYDFENNYPPLPAPPTSMYREYDGYQKNQNCSNYYNSPPARSLSPIKHMSNKPCACRNCMAQQNNRY